MKTLKDEIVEALKTSAEIIYELENKPNIKHCGLELFRENTVNLAAKVESARCENCDSKDELLKDMADALSQIVAEVKKHAYNPSLEHMGPLVLDSESVLQKYHEQIGELK